MPCRNMGQEDADFAVCCAVPVDAPGSPSSRGPRAGPARSSSTARALLAQVRPVAPASCMFDRVFVPWERVFYAGEWEHSGHAHLQLRDASPAHLHRRARGLRRSPDRRGRADVRGQRLRSRARNATCASRWSSSSRSSKASIACGVAASVYGQARRAQRHLHAGPGVRQHRQAAARRRRSTTCTASRTMCRGGLIVALPGPDEDHNPATAARLADVLRANPTSRTKSASRPRASSRT